MQLCLKLADGGFLYCSLTSNITRCLYYCHKSRVASQCIEEMMSLVSGHQMICWFKELWNCSAKVSISCALFSYSCLIQWPETNKQNQGYSLHTLQLGDIFPKSLKWKANLSSKSFVADLKLDTLNHSWKMISLRSIRRFGFFSRSDRISWQHSEQNGERESDYYFKLYTYLALVLLLPLFFICSVLMI